MTHEEAEGLCQLLRQANIDRTFKVIGDLGVEPSIICITHDDISKIKDPKGYNIVQGVPCRLVDTETGEGVIDILRVTPIY